MLIFRNPCPVRLLRYMGVFALSLVLHNAQAATPTDEVLQVVAPSVAGRVNEQLRYFYSLLELALAKTEAVDGPFDVQMSPWALTGARFISQLEKGNGIDVIWSMTNDELERRLLRIPIPLQRGLNSHRVFLIREGDQDIFSAINSLAELKALRAGMVKYWPDTAILKANGLTVVTARYELLFKMLSAGRIDYLPRSLYEVWQEQEAHASEGLVIEKSLMLYYHGPIYFFVNRNNKALAERIERGLRIAIKDGSFDKLFFSVPGVRQGFSEMTQNKRQVFDLSR